MVEESLFSMQRVKLRLMITRAGNHSAAIWCCPKIRGPECSRYSEKTAARDHAAVPRQFVCPGRSVEDRGQYLGLQVRVWNGWRQLDLRPNDIGIAIDHTADCPENRSQARDRGSNWKTDVLAHLVPPIEELTTIAKNMCDAVHTTRALSLRRSVAHVAVPRPSTTTHPRRNQWSRRRTFATQSYSATPRVGQGRRCRRGPRTHVWGRHVDCVGRLRVQVPRPTDDAQVKRRTRQAPQNGSSLVRPLAPTNRTVGWVVVESPGRIPMALSFSGARRLDKGPRIRQSK